MKRNNLLNLSTMFVLTFIISQIFLQLLLVQCQMIPISEVKTHPPPASQVKKKVEQDPKIKSEIHTKIASSHIKDENKNLKKNDEDENQNNKIFLKDKPIELQNPEKHASESWLLHFLLERYIQNSLSNSNDENIITEQIDILQNLEHFVHKYENGRDLFINTNALIDILLPALNSSHIEIRAGSCSIFAVAAQNNKIVQQKSYQVGVVRHLIHILTSDTSIVKSKALYAISSLLLNFPMGQEKFIQDGGIVAIIKVAFLPETRKRSLTFITDLINERKNCDEKLFKIQKIKNKIGYNSKDNNDNNDDDSIEISDPCDKIGLLESSLRINGWCNILEDSVKNIAGFGDDEQIIILDAVTPSLDICLEGLIPLGNYFQHLLLKFDGDEELKEVNEKLKEILKKLNSGRRISLPFERTEL